MLQKTGSRRGRCVVTGFHARVCVADPLSPSTVCLCRNVCKPRNRNLRPRTPAFCNTHLCANGSFQMIAHTHTCVLHKAGVRGRSFGSRGLRMLLSSRVPVHVRQKQALLRCHGACDGDCADMCFEKKKCVSMGLFAVCMCVNFPDPWEQKVTPSFCKH